MNNNIPPDKVKYDDILPFPASSVAEGSPFEEIGALKERIAQLENANAELKNKNVSLLNTIAAFSAIIADRGESRPEIKAPVEAPKPPESRPLPEEDKMINRLALCSELVRLLIELGKEMPFGASPKLFAGTTAPRVYFVDDNSYLYFDKAGRIYPGAPTIKCKGRTARYVLGKLYEMRDYLPSPIIQAALLKSQFKAAP